MFSTIVVLCENIVLMYCMLSLFISVLTAFLALINVDKKNLFASLKPEGTTVRTQPARRVVKGPVCAWVKGPAWPRREACLA